MNVEEPVEFKKKKKWIFTRQQFMVAENDVGQYKQSSGDF